MVSSPGALCNLPASNDRLGVWLLQRPEMLAMLNLQGGEKPMDLQIEYRPGNVRVILQGPRDS